MYDTTWENKAKYKKEQNISIGHYQRQIIFQDVQYASLLYWKEHCSECAPPQCYTQCPIYIKRKDRKCVRMRYGFFRNKEFSGLYPYGIDCRFEKWGKIETHFNQLAFTPKTLRKIALLSHLLSSFVLRVSLLLRFISPTLKPTGLLNFLMLKVIYSKKRKVTFFDAFVFECFSPENDNFRIIFNIIDVDGKNIFSNSFFIKYGWNYFTIPFSSLNMSQAKGAVRILLAPEDNDRNARIIITWLDFILYDAKFKKIIEASAVSSVVKIKCVAWDLDNTLWKGVLEESDLDKLEIDNNVIEAIKFLDQRGILNTIISKNTHEKAWAILEGAGLSEYFVFPSINWLPKSENLRTFAKQVNIGLDSIAFIDDSPHEREEVTSRLPMVKVFSDKDIQDIFEKPEFDVPITEEGKIRRLSYLAEMERIRFSRSFTSDGYDAFLAELGMHIAVFTPETNTNIERCLELLQRSNQLNLTTYRYTREEFINILSDAKFLCLAFSCYDKFGDYGTVGFLCVEKEKPFLRIKDMVISCRVAQKKIEQTILTNVISKFIGNGYTTLIANLITTKKNGPIKMVFDSLAFTHIEEKQNQIIYTATDLNIFINMRTPCLIDIFDFHNMAFD